MQVDGNLNQVKRAFVMFDLSSIPAGSTVNSASLSLCFPKAPQAGAAGHIHELHLVTSTWTESGLTWNTQPAAAVAVTDFITVPATAQCVTFTTTADVQAWVNGTSNFGWRVNDQDEMLTTGYNAGYATREEPAIDQRPWLTVTYTPP